MLITNNYGSMINANKTVIHIAKLRSGHDLYLLHAPWLLFKNFTHLQKVNEIKENFALAKKKKKNAKSLNIKYGQRGIKIKQFLPKIETIGYSSNFLSLYKTKSYYLKLFSNL